MTDPGKVARVDQAEALVSEVLANYLDTYRARRAVLPHADALVLLGSTIHTDALRGSKGLEGLVSLAAVAIAKLVQAADDARATLYQPCGHHATDGCACNASTAEAVEPWHGKATFTGDDGRQQTLSVGRPRCSRCYGVGHYASACTVGL